MAIQGFRTAGLTPSRIREFNNAMASDILTKLAWEVFDAHSITLPRPDATIDGIHYAGILYNFMWKVCVFDHINITVWFDVVCITVLGGACMAMADGLMNMRPLNKPRPWTETEPNYLFSHELNTHIFT